METVQQPTTESNELLDKKKRAKEIIGRVYKQLTKGCGREFCTNKDCASNKLVWKDKKMSEKEALKMAINFTKTINIKNDLKICKNQVVPKTIQIEEVEKLEEMSDEQIVARYIEVFSCPFCLSFSFLKDRESYLETEHHNIDFELLAKYYRFLDRKIGEERLVEVFKEANEKFYDKFKSDEKDIEEPWIFRSIFIIMQNHILFNPNCYEIIDCTNMLLVDLYNNFKDHRDRVKLWVSQFTKGIMLDNVQKIQTIMTINIFSGTFVADNINNCIDVLDIYYNADQAKPEGDRLNYAEFYNDGINKEVDLRSHYDRWIRGLNYCRENGVVYKKALNYTLCNYPWLLDTITKGDILKEEAKVQMQEYGYKDLANMYIMGITQQNPGEAFNESDFLFLKLEIGRETIIEDTLNGLIKEGINLKKQLKISFRGEFGQDEGGVQKEFFQILVRDLFNPGYTMFDYNRDSKFVWFNGNTFESNIKFELIGVLMGLAIYNGVILDIHFPIACYKKLLDIEPTLNDLTQLNPSMGESLKYILESTSQTLQDELYLTFTVETDVFGETKLYELVPNGREIYVNQENKEDYVRLMIDYIFNTSIRNQFDAFYRGFHKVCGGDALSLFIPEELERLICGSKNLDFSAMQRETRYDGYEGEEEVIDWFWEIILEEFTQEQQKRFLFFCTGCDKAPVAGLESIDFIIMKHGEGDERLPCAQTCFNLLLLPEYTNKARLKAALLLAIDNAEGFGLL